MLLPGGPFEHFSGSLVVVGPNRTVLYCNPAGKALAALLQGPDSPQLRAAVEGAFNGRPAQFSPFRPGGQDQPGAVLDLTVMPWDGGAAVVLLGRDITFERAQRDALRGELARARRKVHFNHTLTDLLTKGLDLDLLADVMLRGLVGSLDLAGAQLLEACPPPGPRCRALATAGAALPDGLLGKLQTGLRDGAAFTLRCDDISLLAQSVATAAPPDPRRLVLVIWRKADKPGHVSGRFDDNAELLRHCLERLRAA